MKRYSLARPLLLLATAYLANTLTSSISTMLGASKETASNIGFMAMIIAAVIVFIRLNKANKRK